MDEKEFISIRPAGDMAVLVKTGKTISPTVNRKVRQLLFALESENIPGIVEMVPAYNELMVYYQPWVLDLESLMEKIKNLDKTEDEITTPPTRRVYIPVCYGGSYGPDLSHVASVHATTEQQVIQIHTKPDYLVYMLGFSPGFCYLGGLDERIATPRKENPRTLIPAGSVGIAGKQTGVYPVDSPGGWQIIGRTPVKLFNPSGIEPFLLRPGDLLSFQSVDKEIFEEISIRVQNQAFQPQIDLL